MTEFEGLYKAVIKLGPREIGSCLANIPGIHKQEALDNSLEKAITLAIKPSIQNIKYLLYLGADPNGPSGEEGFALNHAYATEQEPIVELLLLAGADPNAEHSNVLEQAVKNNDLAYVLRFVEAGANINDRSKLKFADNLLDQTTNKEIQKYLIEKGLDTTGLTLPKNLAAIPTPSIDEFDYPNPGYNPESIISTTANVPTVSPCNSTNSDDLYIKDYSSKYFMVCGNTKNHQEVLRKNGGRYIRRGWIVPNSKREFVETMINEMGQTPIVEEEAESESEDVKYSVSEENTPTPVDEFVEQVLADGTIKRPFIKESDTITLHTPLGKYGYMLGSFSRPNLFYLDSHYWDSVDRYLMYKMYEGSRKAEAIKKAETLDEAKRKFNVKHVPIAKTPKQLVINQKLQPLAESEINKRFVQNKEKYFCNATTAKFKQNKLFMNKLLQTAPKYIINKNGYDIFGYEGNLLGNTLIKLRDGEQQSKDIPKTNNLTMDKYIGNTHFYVIRGDPDQQKATDIRRLGTYRTKTGKVIRGKLNLNLQGGPGWLIPTSKKTEAKQLIFDTLPDDNKIQILGRDWIKNRIKKFLQVAIVFSKFQEHREVGSEDLMFAIKDIFGGEDFYISDTTQPDNHFKETIWKYAAKHNVTISDNTIQLLWDFLSKMAEEITHSIETSSQMKKLLHNIEHSILDMKIDPLSNLTERESIIISSFNRIYRLLRKIAGDTDSKACVTAVHIMLGDYYYEQIRDIYAAKTKLKGGKNYADEEDQFIDRFEIKTPHLHEILKLLPNGLSKKCKLLILTTVDYIMNMEDDDAITISKRLIILSQKGRQPSPTPSIGFSDIPQLTPGELMPTSPTKSPAKVDDIVIVETPKATMPSSSPEKSPKKSPNDSPEKSPKKSPEKSPKKSPNDSPEKSPKKSPEKSPDDSPEKSPDDSPEKSPDDSPEKSPDDSPEFDGTPDEIETP